MKKLLELIEQLKMAEKEQKEFSQIVRRKIKGKYDHNKHQAYMAIYNHYGMRERYEKIRNLKQKINQLRLRYWYWE
jgi:hypothetical protein